ncbi:MAG: hypothetical protein WC459_04545 [Patescibacteria group bacterium]
MKRRFKLIYLVYFLPIFALAYLVWQNARPILDLNYSGKKTAIAGELVPAARVGTEKDEEGEYKIIKEEPVYFDVRLPRKYDRVKMEINYSNLNNELFEAGISRDAAKKSFDFSALENKALDGLSWHRVEEGGLVLYQRQEIYKSIGEFLSNPGGFNNTLIYRTEVLPKLSDLKSAGETATNFPVLQSLKMAVYHRGGILDIKADADGEFNVYVYNNEGRAESGRDLPAGLYTINIAGGEEIVFNKIFINSPYVAILGKIKFGELQEPLKIFFAGSRILAITDKAEGVQEIEVGGKKLDINRVSEQRGENFETIGLRNANVPRGNIELGAALFFLDNKNIFYPSFENFYNGADLSGIDFILARYSAPEERGETKTAKAEFDISGSQLSGGKIRFLLSLPNSSKGNLVKIRGINLEFSGEKYDFKKIIGKIFGNLIR